MQKRIILALIITSLLSISFVLAAGSSSGGSSGNSLGSSTEMTFTVKPYKVDCQALVPTKCLVVNGEYFYDPITGFDYEEDYNYVIKVRRTQVYASANAPADISLYAYTLIRIVSKTSTAETLPSGRTTCEDIDTPRGRILCRITNKATLTDSSSVVEEACRGRSGTINEEKCKALYSRLKKSNCYELDSAVDKKKCFLKESGININQGETFRASPNEAKRSYVVTLLYELQEKIEKLQESGKITAEESASLVAKIVEIKQMILDGKARSEVVPKMQEFKNEYKSVITEGEQ